MKEFLPVEQIIDIADQKLLELAKQEYGAEITSTLLDQFRVTRSHAGRIITDIDVLPANLAESYIPETFLEFLGETTTKNKKQIQQLVSRECQIPILEPDILPTCPASAFEIENLPLDLAFKSPFGTATLFSCVPFLEDALEEAHPTNSEFTAGDILRRYLGVLKLHYILVTKEEFNTIQSKRRSNGKLTTLTFTDLEAQASPDMSTVMTMIEAIDLLDKKRKDEETQMEYWDKEKIENILAAIKANKPKDRSASRTEWTALTTNYPFVSLENSPIQEKLVAIFPAEAQKRFQCFPLHQEKGMIMLAVHQIPTIQDRGEIATRIALQCKIQFILASHGQVMALINKALSVQVNLKNIAEEITHEDTQEDIGSELIDIQALIETREGKEDETTVIQLLQGLVVQAVQDKATDIHVASGPDFLSIRFRIDGVLIPYPHQIRKSLDRPLITRIKIVSDINTQKTGMPEDGKYSTVIGGLKYEIRVTTSPTVHGEKAILRVQPKSSQIPTLESLGFQGVEKQVVIKAVDANHGLLVICGPTGGGKSTTLYAAIGLIDRVQWNVVTGEQPVEIEIPGCEQTTINNTLTYPVFARATLRQDPDYIMIGETRDEETTRELIRASVTGHNVLTTLHTDSAPSAPSRMIDLGAKPYLLAAALTGVCAQQLIRRLCTNCLEQVPIPSTKKLQELGIQEDWLLGRSVIGQPTGCKMCRKTGYAGRIAIIEGYTVTKPIRDIIQYKNADPSAIRAIMEEQGSKTLFQYAVENVAKGICSLSDALIIGESA